jgi:hypothetical protein
MTDGPRPYRSPASATNGVAALLVRGEYEAVERMTDGDRLTAARLRSVVEEYGRTLTAPGPDGDWWSHAEVFEVKNAARPVLAVDVDLWTEEEGRSDLTLQLELTETPEGLYEAAVLDLHVL